MTHYCYILYNDTNNSTYNGYTNNLERRLRQHNKEIKGGAKYTTRQDVQWKYLVTIESEDFTYNTALSHEWSIKYPTNKRPRPKEYQGALGRIRSLPLVFKNPKFGGIKFVVKLHDERHNDLLANVLDGLDNVSIVHTT